MGRWYQGESMSKLTGYLNSLTKARVLVIGDLILDHYIWGKVDRVSPEAPVPVVMVTRENFMPGGCANVALNIRALDGRVAVCGVVGRDLYGRKLVDFLKKHAIDTAGVITDDTRPTTLKTRIIAQHQHVVRVDKEEVRQADGRVMESIRRFLKAKLCEFNVIIVSDYAKGFINEAVIKELRKYAGNETIILADPKVKNMALFRNFYLVTPNRKEVVEAAGLYKGDGENAIIESGRKIMKELSLKNLLVTRGEDGMSLFMVAKHIRIPTFAQEVFDVSGAGDTVIAAVAAGLSGGLDLVKSCILSNIAASVVVGKMGTATATRNEIEKKWEDMDNKVKKQLEHYL
jgi:rfaE bifunctional protein kinase chain/domain